VLNIHDMLSYLRISPPDKFRDRLTEYALMFATLLAYGSCAVVPYASCDDYGQMTFLQFGWTDWTNNQLGRDGRPIASALICWGFKTVGSLGSLCILRAINLVGALFFSRYSFRHFLRMGMNRWNALAIACIIVLTPGIGEHIGWAVAWPFMPVMLLTLWLGAWFSERVESASAVKTMILSVAACAVLLLVILTYQPIAGIFIIIPFLWLAIGKMRPAAIGTAVLLAAFGVYKFAIFPGLHALVPAWCSTERANINLSQLGEHLSGLFHDFIPFVASGWFPLVTPRAVWLVIGSIVILAALYGLYKVAARWNGSRFWLALALASAAFAVSCPHVFLINDIWSYRANSLMAIFIGITAWIGVSSLVKPTRIAVLSMLVCCTLFLCATYSVAVGLAYSNMREESITQKQLENLRNIGASRAYVIVGPDDCRQQAFVPIYQRSNYGMISLPLLREWEVEAVARVVWKDSDSTRPELVYVSADKVEAIPSDGTPIVDLWGGISRHRTQLPERLHTVLTGN
jgi:hypothetical protein